MSGCCRDNSKEIILFYRVRILDGNEIVVVVKEDREVRYLRFVEDENGLIRYLIWF